MDRKIKLAIIGSAAALIIILILAVQTIIKMNTPSNEKIQLTDYYKVNDSEALVILQNELYEKNALLIDGRVYIDYDTVISKFNHRFYWDNNENILTYTTPDEIIRAGAGDNKYSVTKSTTETEVTSDYPIVEVSADTVYLSLDFIKQYSDLTFEFYQDPNRVVINYIWTDYLYTEVSKNTQLRVEPSIKSPILMELPVGTSLMYVDTEEVPRKGFIKVMTEDGIKGYVKEKNTKEAHYKTLQSTYQAPVYTSLTRSAKINMAFHQIFNESAGDKMNDLIAATKGVNVISPTFFRIDDEKGNISSVATQDYVTKAKDLGLEVWALATNVDKKVDMLSLLSHTSSRENLANCLINMALEYNLNGINIDFEGLQSDEGIHYIEFLRELSVKCRNNGIVLSVDVPVPTSYNKLYDYAEQGEIVDYVVIMAYDENVSDQVGPVSSIGFVKDAVKNTLDIVPKEKTIIAIPFYSRLWKITTDGTTSFENYGMTAVDGLIKDNDLEPKWDDAAGSNYIEYQQDGATYKLWQEEDTSIEEKMKAINDADVAGVAEWKLGMEKESIWNVIGRYLK